MTIFLAAAAVAIIIIAIIIIIFEKNQSGQCISFISQRLFIFSIFSCFSLVSYVFGDFVAPNIGEDMEKTEYLFSLDEIVNLLNFHGEEYDFSCIIMWHPALRWASLELYTVFCTEQAGPFVLRCDENSHETLCC